jgi:hypothetical protein
MNADKTLFAQWGSAPLVIVKYDANGASGAVPADQPYPSGVQVTILGQGSLTNTGNTFLGWNENSSGVGSLYAPGYKFASKNVTLYAQWAPGSTIKSCGPTETYTTGPNTWYDIPYAQVIASTSANTITIFLAAYFGTTQSNVGTGVGPYNIISFTSKTTITPISIINNTYTTYSIPANNYNYSQTILNSSANYWPTSPSLVPISTITFPSINVNSTGSNIHSNPATFNRATALISNGCGIGAHESFFSGPASSIDTQFYFFNQGVTLNYIDGTNTQFVNCPITALYTTNKNSTSAWTTMPISYYPYVGITPATHNTLTAITIIPSPSLGSKSISPPIPDVSLQYNANGLSGENGTKNNVTGLPSSGGLPAPTYFAPYNIAGPTSVAVGGNVGANNYYLTKKDASGNEFIFTKWNTAANGFGTDYGPGFNTTYLSSSGTNILYAQWIPGYYVNYNGNGNTAGSQGVGDVLSPYPTTGSSVVTVRANTSPVGFPGPFTKTGYSFSIWNTQANGLGSDVNPGFIYTITANNLLYAKWNYTVTYNGNGSNGGTVPSASTVGQFTSTTVSGPGTMTKSGSTFDGWYSFISGVSPNYAVGSTYIGPSVTLLAKWV